MEITLEDLKHSVDAISSSQLIILNALQRNFNELQEIQEDHEEMGPIREIPNDGPITKQQALELAARSVQLTVRFPSSRKVAIFYQVTMFGTQNWERGLK